MAISVMGDTKSVRFFAEQNERVGKKTLFSTWKRLLIESNSAKISRNDNFLLYFCKNISFLVGFIMFSLKILFNCSLHVKVEIILEQR